MKSTIRINDISVSHGEHTHDFAQILFGERGNVICELEHGAFKLKQSNALFLPSDCQHLYTGKDTESRLIVVDIPLNDPTLNSICLSAGLDLKQLINEQALFNNISDFSRGVLTSVAQQGSNWNYHHEFVKQQTAILLLTDFLKNQIDESILRENCRLIKKEQIDQIIDRRLTAPPTGEELAKILNMSVSTMIAKFNQNLGMPPNKYIMKRRMEWAKYYIEICHFSLSRVTYELGFSNQPSFTRAFNRYYGFSPKQMKKTSIVN
ncbi:AraC family transcriptional regulator [Acinetobacter sp.]|nr:AraC family transcriptional regulator [Acinetobacter sp.]MDR0238054.1 AraC family transcriptional regulator [Acinetobacter sp.]MDR2277178.1 AraC family transcriptional regulator [Vagococcus sp.]